MSCIDEYSIFGHLADINWCILPMLKQLNIYDNKYAISLYDKIKDHLDCIEDYILKETDGSERWCLMSTYLHQVMEEFYKTDQYGMLVLNKARCDRYIAIIEKCIGPCIKLIKSIIQDYEQMDECEDCDEY